MKNKKIKTIGELLQFQIKENIREIKVEYKNKLTRIKKEEQHNKKNILKSIKNNVIKENIKKLFTLNPLSQLLDETNTLSEISHKRKITCLGKGGVSLKKANLKIREINPSQYGKICPLETTEGKNAGLVLAFSNESKINEDGYIETPFFLR